MVQINVGPNVTGQCKIQSKTNPDKNKLVPNKTQSSPDDIWQIRDTIPTLNYNATPTVFIVIGTYFITKSFFGVYSMAVDTLFLCFLEDMERNDGTPEKPYFMSRGLQKIVGKMQKFNVQKEEHRLEQVRRREHQKKYGT